MAEWSQLPGELVDLISKHLSTEIDFLRLRSVCSSWRSSLPLKPHPSHFPLLKDKGISILASRYGLWDFNLSKSVIYLLRSPNPTTSSNNYRGGWILTLDRQNPLSMRILNPLSKSPFINFPPDFPKILDSSQYPIIELCHEYALQRLQPNGKSIAGNLPPNRNNLYSERVAVSLEKDGFLVLTINVPGKLVMYRSGDTQWSVVHDSSVPYYDVIFKQGNFYAVDENGKVVVVKFSDKSVPELTVIAHPDPAIDGREKFLVEYCGELFMIDRYANYASRFEGVLYLRGRPLKFKVYKLDRDMQKWVEVTDLEDRILFVGDKCTFLVSASELDCAGKGNVIIFWDKRVKKNDNVGLFSLENGSIGPIGRYPGYSDLFWPPPPWISQFI